MNNWKHLQRPTHAHTEEENISRVGGGRECIGGRKPKASSSTRSVIMTIIITIGRWQCKLLYSLMCRWSRVIQQKFQVTSEGVIRGWEKKRVPVSSVLLLLAGCSYVCWRRQAADGIYAAAVRFHRDQKLFIFPHHMEHYCSGGNFPFKNYS